jgi:uncharacterized protein (AIM24 family)
MKLLEKRSVNKPDYVVDGDFIDYSIRGENAELLNVKLDPTAKRTFYGNPSNLVYIKGDVQSHDVCMIKKGDFIKHKHKKIISALKKILVGNCIYVTHHKFGKKGGAVGYAGNCPGNILAIRLSNETILAQHDVFMAAFGDFELSVDLSHEPEAFFLRSQALLLERLSGTGIVFLQAGGDLFDALLAKDEPMQVEFGAAVAWEESVQFGIELSGFESTLSGKGIFLNTLRGPGRAIFQTMSLTKRKSCTHSASFGPIPLMFMDACISRLRRMLKLPF